MTTRFPTATGVLVMTCLALGLGSCASYSPKNYVSHHMIPVTEDGKLDRFDFNEPLLPGNSAPMRGRDVDEHIQIILDAAVANAAARGVAPGDPIKLLVHIHGGRKPTSSSTEMIDRTLIAMQDDPTMQPKDQWYPIFYRWPSWDIGAAMRRVSSLRQGRRVGVWVSLVTTPFVLAQDIVTGVVRWPQSFVYQVFRDSAVANQVLTGKRLMPSWDHAHRIAKAMENGSVHPTFDVVEGSYKRSTWQHGVRLAAYFPTQVLKIPMQALVLEGLGQDAWDEMRRRVHSLVWLPATFERDRDGMNANDIVKAATETGANGALPALYHALENRNEDFTLFLVAHSMGATAMNEGMKTLRSVLKASAGSVEVERVLYMAPACSVGDAAESLVPLLSENSQTQFHLMTLHPVAEADEINLYDAVPRGSLLEWIDHYYTNPATHTERVFGKWSNAVPALNLFAEVRDQVHFKAFSVEPGSVPVAHGQFHSIPFWRSEAYSTTGPMNYPANWLEDTCATCIGGSGGKYLPW